MKSSLTFIAFVVVISLFASVYMVRVRHSLEASQEARTAELVVNHGDSVAKPVPDGVGVQ